MERVSAWVRERKQPIIDRWEAAMCAKVPVLRRLPRGALIDHLPEFLDELADWVASGTPEDGEDARLHVLAEGHAIQRLGHGIDLDVLTLEYSALRREILHELLGIDVASPNMRLAMIRLNAGMDIAIHEAVHRYSARRDAIRERFLGILGHDLRNPLNVITIGAETLLGVADLSANHVAVALKMRLSAARMGRMVHDLMDFARGHLGGGIPAIPADNDMGEMCLAAVEELRITNPDRLVHLHVSGDLRGAWDRDRIVQALSNLLSNALHHGQDPILVEAHEKNAHTIVTTVSNGGTPMPPDVLAAPFDPFRRGSSSRPGSGLGLGLYIVQQIALAHGGQCTVSSDVQRTTFTIAWPRTPIREVPDRT